MASLCKAFLLGFLFFAKISCILNEEIYIIPLAREIEREPCPVEQCLTLSQFTSNTAEYLPDETLLKFLPGNHQLDSQLYVTNVSNISMVLSESNFLPTTIISCTHPGGFQFIHVEFVVINGLTFIGCGGNKIEFVNQVTIEDSSFLGGDNSETALELVETIASIVRCLFTNNTIGSYRGPIRILQTAADKNPKVPGVSTWCGGAIIASNSTMVISESVLHANNATVGGAIFSSSSNITIINSTLIKNVANSTNNTPCHGGLIHCENDQYSSIKLTVLNSKFIYSGACFGGSVSALFSNVHIANSLFHDNYAITGGVVFGLETDLSIHNCTFVSNFALQTGGAIVLGNGSVDIHTTNFINNQGEFCGVLYLYTCTITIINCSFVNNRALGNGGVLGVVKGSNASIQKNQFQHNSAKQGGVIYVNLQSTVTVSDNHFTNNRVLGVGGVFWTYQSSLRIEASMFSYNMALTNCSSFSSSMSTIDIFKSEFVNNTAWRNGGVLCSNMMNEMTIDSCRFVYNRAKQGGVIHTAAGSRTVVYNTKFVKNIAQDAGVFATYDSNVTIMESDFSENQAQFGGAFLFMSHSLFVAVDSNFSGNTATVGGGVLFTNGGCDIFIKNSHFEMNGAKQGGVWSALRAKLTVINSTFYENSAINDTGVGSAVYFSHMIIKSCLFKNNTAGLAGVLSGTYNTSVTITDSEFVDNTAQNGGVIILVSRTKSVIERSKFNNNQAESGSVLYLQIQSSVIINNSVLKNNMGNSEGAIIGYTNTIVIIIGSKLIKNVVEKGPGGVISIRNGSSTVIKNCQLSNNRGSPGGVVHLMMNSSATIDECTMNNNTAFFGGVLAGIEKSSATITDCIMNDNIAFIGGVLAGHRNFTAKLINSTLIDNTATEGGAIFLIQGRMVIEKSRFFNNQANVGGVARAENESSLIIKESVLNSNAAVIEDITAILDQRSLYKQLQDILPPLEEVGFIYGHDGTISTSESKLTVLDCTFSKNTANHSGGVLGASSTTLLIRRSQFYNNSATTGSALAINESPTADLDNCSFIGNTAYKLGGAIMASGGNFHIKNSLFSYNSASFGVVYITSNKAFLSGTIMFSDNNGSVYAYSSELNFNGNMHFFHCLAMNSEENEGGAITAFQSKLTLNGSFTLMNNYAKSGGAIYLIETKMSINNSDVTIANNTATVTGGGIYLYRSQLDCQENGTLTILGNEAAEKGGGMHAVGSTVNVYVDYKKTLLHFIENTAKDGGGISFEVDSKLYIYKIVRNRFPISLPIKVSFIRNSAMYGGAMHVADSTYFKICESTNQYGKKRSIIVQNQSTKVECFFQVLVASLGIIPNITSINIGFTENYASIAGSDLYGGLLDRCTANSFTFLYFKVNRTENVRNNLIINGVAYFLNVSNTDNSLDGISSGPVRVCFCKDDKPDCSYHPPTKEVKKGETFHQSLVAVDQVNHTLSDIKIHSSLMFKESGLGEGQLSQKTGISCTDLNFTIFSPHSFEELIMYAQGPCKDANISQSVININFKNCTCPIGFQPKAFELTDCVCECNKELLGCVSDCNQHNSTLVRNSSCWFDYSFNETSGHNYVIYEYCPYDYCLPPESRTEINLNDQYGADAQCAHNRSGVLCGTCQPGLSLSIGSSHCLKCPINWAGLLVAYMLAAILTGILLVALLLWLNLTVAVGTLNGILFYANIVVVSNNLSFATPNYISMFLSWLNLELGIDVCLFEGMDTYWKTWLELTFPAYVIFLVVIVIFLSERYMWFGRLIGKKNPVAALATLILLSYTKLLRTIIASFSLAILDYPDGSREIVWLPDASIKYLRGKHIPLFITAILILLAGMAYTSILFSWQWLLQHQNKTTFKWVRNQKLCLFLEPYHAPYTFKHRYWTGLLLLIRVTLYLIMSVVNRSNDPAVNLLATGTVMTVFLISKGMLGNSNRIYKKWLVELLEMLCYFNVSLFSVAKLYVLEASSDPTNILGYISGTLTLSIFIFVLSYHVFTEVLLKANLLKKLKYRRQRNEEQADQVLNDFPPVDNDQRGPAELTVSFIEAPQQGEVPLSALVEAGLEKEIADDSKHYKTSITIDDERKEDIKATEENSNDVISINSGDDITGEVSPLIVEHTQ